MRGNEFSFSWRGMVAHNRVRRIEELLAQHERDLSRRMNGPVRIPSLARQYAEGLV